MAHHRAGDQHVDRGERDLAARAVEPVPPASRDQHARSAPPRRRSRRPAADPRSAPTSGFISSRQRSSSCSMRSRSSISVRSSARSAVVGDGAQPGADALGRIVADAFDLDRLASARRDSSRAVGVGDERLVGVRRQQLLGDVVPDRLEALRCCRAATRRRRPAPAPAAAAVRSPSRTSVWNACASRSVERVAGDHVARDEARDRRVGHAADDRLHQRRAFVVGCRAGRAGRAACPASSGRPPTAMLLQHRLELLRLACFDTTSTMPRSMRISAARLERRCRRRCRRCSRAPPSGRPAARCRRRCRAARGCRPRRARTRCPAGSWR